MNKLNATAEDSKQEGINNATEEKNEAKDNLGDTVEEKDNVKANLNQREGRNNKRSRNSR